MKTSPIREDGEVKSRQDYINESDARRAAAQSERNVGQLLNMLESINK